MSRSWMQNPFKTHDVSDFPGVYKPMAQQRQQSVTSDKVKKDEDSDAASTSTSEPALTIESLRAEIDSDLAAGGHDTAYDRMLLQQNTLQPCMRVFGLESLPHHRQSKGH